MQEQWRQVFEIILLDSDFPSTIECRRRITDHRRRVLPLNASFVWDVVSAEKVELNSTLPAPQTASRRLPQTPEESVSVKNQTYSYIWKPDFKCHFKNNHDIHIYLFKLPLTGFFQLQCFYLIYVHVMQFKNLEGLQKF